jgi:hypothetical protein
MKQANQMQMKMKKAQEAIALMEFEGTSGGGAVKVKVNGDHKVLAMTINEEIFKSGDAEMLQDMVMLAVNDAMKTAKEASAKEMEKITGGAGIPGLF